MKKKKTKNKKGRPAKILTKFYEYDFAQEAKKELDANMRVKLLSLEQVKRGKGFEEVAKIFNFHGKTIKSWVKIASEEGLAGLKIKPGRGRKTKLPKDKIVEFKAAIAELQNKRSGGRINVADITQMSNDRFATCYKVKGMYSFLHKINMVWISARSKHQLCNADAQNNFKKTL